MDELLVKCDNCDGTGKDGHDRSCPPDWYICEKCKGTGKSRFDLDRLRIIEFEMDLQLCPFCMSISKIFYEQKSNTYCVVCQDDELLCNARIPYHNSLEECVQVWNNRKELNLAFFNNIRKD